jgi:hypothetical protein
MNSLSTVQPMRSLEDLQAERERLTARISHQKDLIRQDFEKLREEAAQKIHPVAEAAGFVKKLTTPETRATSLFQIGSTVLVEAVVRKMFVRTPLIVQMVVPNLVKNYFTHLLFTVAEKVSKNRERHLNEFDS